MITKKYSHVFFDLDHTLWDFESNNRLTFDEILDKYKLYGPVIANLDAFMEVYTPHNKMLWDLYKEGKIEKSFLSYRRFELSLQHFGFDDIELAKTMAADYIRISPTKTILMDGTIGVLSYLQSKYMLGLITNGFDEIQFVKIMHAGLKHFFPIVVTSEQAGCKKPDPGIFAYTLAKADASAEACIYIGDDPETDVVGAKKAGIDQVLLTFGKTFKETGATHTIESLHQLKEIL